MCGLIAVVAKTKSFDVALFDRLMTEAQIRGQHSTGLASVNRNKSLNTINHAVPAHLFPRADFSSLIHPTTQAAVGHFRYSTSGGTTNQPIMRNGVALAHNGVVSQAPKQQWSSLFDVECEGDNDSEILLQYYLSPTSQHPLDIQSSSQACVVLTPQELVFWRNEERPLYYSDNDHEFIVSSTKDILIRAGVTKKSIVRCESCVEYRINVGDPSVPHVRAIRKSNTDLQP